MNAVGGCAFHAQGLVGPEGGPEAGRTGFDTLDGEHYRLALDTDDTRPMAFLDGHTTEIDGTRVFRTVHVTDWKVTEGLHAMPAFVGKLEEHGVQVGLLDRNSKAFYFIDPDAAELLAPEVGKWALVEGYVDGPQRVHVVYYRVLAP